MHTGRFAAYMGCRRIRPLGLVPGARLLRVSGFWQAPRPRWIILPNHRLSTILHNFYGCVPDGYRHGCCWRLYRRSVPTSSASSVIESSAICTVAPSQGICHRAAYRILKVSLLALPQSFDSKQR